MSTLSTNRGFTLVEATVAIVILSIGIFSVIQFFPFSIKIIGDSQNLTLASNLALSKLEETRSLNYEDITVGTIEAKTRVSSDPADYLYNYQRETIVELLDSTLTVTQTDVGLKKITSTVYWRSAVGNIEKSTTASMIVSDL